MDLFSSVAMSCHVVLLLLSKLLFIYLFNRGKLRNPVWTSEGTPQIKVSHQNETLCHALCMSSIIVAVWWPRFMCVLSAVHMCHVMLLLTSNHASCQSFQQCMYVMLYCCWSATMIYVGFVGSECMSSTIIADQQPCFVRVLLVVHICRVVLLLPGNHALCRSCQQCMLVM